MDNIEPFRSVWFCTRPGWYSSCMACTCTPSACSVWLSSIALLSGGLLRNFYDEKWSSISSIKNPKKNCKIRMLFSFCFTRLYVQRSPGQPVCVRVHVPRHANWPNVHDGNDGSTGICWLHVMVHGQVLLVIQSASVACCTLQSYAVRVKLTCWLEGLEYVIDN